MKDPRFFICKHCGNIITMIEDQGVPVVCCGEKMEEMVAGTVDASKEKHVPVMKVDGNLVTVEVGSVVHPMEEKHYITFVALESENGTQLKKLLPGAEPKAVFALAPGDKAKAVYEHCNLHGLWKTEA